jgi:hypothetical protein
VAIVALTNSSSPVTVERATADGDPYERETQLNGLALNFDAHDHTSAKGLGVGRVQTSAPPAASGQVRANGDAWQWWGATAGAVRTALDLEGAQTISGAKTFTGGVRVDPHLGVGVTPAAWHPDLRVAQAGALGVVGGVAGGASPNTSQLLANSYYDGAFALRAVLNNQPGAFLDLGGGKLAFYNMAAVAAGAAQASVKRLEVAPTGTLSLFPDGGAAALSLNNTLAPFCNITANHYLTITVPAAFAMMPTVDNSFQLGYPTTGRWSAVYAVNGTIQTSSEALKEGITPLDPAACYQAAKDVRWYEYAYLPPAYTPQEPPPDIAYDAADDNETKAEKKARRDEAEAQAKAAHLKAVAETAPARHQRGFVFGGAEAKDEAGAPLPPVPDLFGLDDRESTTPQADLATLGCALQEVIRRLEALEGVAP